MESNLQEHRKEKRHNSCLEQPREHQKPTEGRRSQEVEVVGYRAIQPKGEGQRTLVQWVVHGIEIAKVRHLAPLGHL